MVVGYLSSSCLGRQHPFHGISPMDREDLRVEVTISFG
jgi:hypothetical protein